MSLQTFKSFAKVALAFKTGDSLTKWEVEFHLRVFYEHSIEFNIKSVDFYIS